MTRRVDAATLRAWHDDGGELAILDAREEGEYAAGHLFWAASCPLSRRELRARLLLPRLATRIVCVDGGGGEAARLADWLAAIGAGDLSVLDGGTPAWERAGHVLFSGVNVPSKAFGEWVEHHYGTASVDPDELARWQAEGRNLVVLDSRPFSEFTRMSIPGGINVPGAELAYRIADIAPDPATTVVVNCAGRTRSILGAESLRRAGVPNPVRALRNGTMGWELAGFAVARGETRRFPPGRPVTAGLALARARTRAEAAGVGVLGPLDLARYEEDPAHTLYVLDVRDPEEYRAGHRPGSRSAPGGQLVQSTDQWIAVRHARIALIDDDGVRARMTGAWLAEMGHDDVFVVENALSEADHTGPDAVGVPELAAEVPLAAPDAVDAAGSVVVDVSRSLEYREGHIPGALWGVRSRLDRLRGRLEGASRVVVTSPDGTLARLAVPELAALAGCEVQALRGGNAAWRAAGRLLAADRGAPPDAECVDVCLRPYDRNEGVEAAMRAYLAWETDLPRLVAHDGTVRFGVRT